MLAHHGEGRYNGRAPSNLVPKVAVPAQMPVVIYRYSPAAKALVSAQIADFGVFVADFKESAA